ncbi:MAG TPA: DnaJ C-terminal domain-containing protein [Pseudonocardiaceae bacterium]|nr:DnaJ C-terminal domain-containing protein [Pseudonocardiaceae bacterium]
MPGADQEAELELTVEDAYRGGTRRITLSGPGEPVSFEVQIPPGITEGQRIRICWPGCAGLPQWPSGGLAPGGADRTASPVPGQRAPQLVGLVTVPAADRLAT